MNEYNHEGLESWHKPGVTYKLIANNFSIYFQILSDFQFIHRTIKSL